MGPGGVNFDDLIASKSSHEQAINTLAIEEFRLENRLEVVSRQMEQRRGAIAELEQLMRRFMQVPQGPPANDPNAESDQ